MKKLLLAAIVSIGLMGLLATPVLADQPGANFWRFDFTKSLLFLNQQISSVLFGGTSTSTTATVEIQGSTPLGLPDLAGEDCLGTDADGLVGAGNCTGGGGGSSVGDVGDIQYSDGAGGFNGDSRANYDGTQFRIGTSSPIYDGNVNEPLLVVSDIDDYSAIAIQNLNPLGVSSFIAYANNDDGEIITGKYVELTMTGEDYDGGDLIGGNDGALAVNGGNLILATNSPGDYIDITTGGDLQENRRIRIQDDRTSFLANYDTDIAKDVASSTLWTGTNGWSVSDGLEKATNASTGVIYPSSSSTIAIGTTYKVTITPTSTATTTPNKITYTLGGVSGTSITNVAITDYITALTDADIIISGVGHATTTIIGVEILPLIDDTGDVFIDGNLTIGSELKVSSGASVLNISGGGIATFAQYPLLPQTYATEAWQPVPLGQVNDLFTSGARYVGSANAIATSTLAGFTYSNGASGVGAQLTAGSNGVFPTIDTVVPVLGYKYLIVGQTSAFQNGYYELTTLGDGGTPAVLTRITTYDESSQIVSGTFFGITGGAEYPTGNRGTQWYLTTTGTITVGTTNLVYDIFRFPTAIFGGDGIDVTGDVVSVLLSATPGLEFLSGALRVFTDETTIERSALGLRIKAGAIDLASNLISGILGVVNGGTGVSDVPEYGEVLVGDGTGIYELVATSSLGIIGGSGTENFTTSTFANTNRLVWTTLQASWSSVDSGDVLFGSATYYKRMDLTNAYRFQTIRAMGTAGPANTSIKLQYSYDRTNWFDASSGAADTCTLVGTESKPCPYGTLVEGARNDVYLRYVSVGGTGTAVSFRDLTTAFSVYATTDNPNATTTQAIPWSVGGTFLQWANIPLAKSGGNYINFSSATYNKRANLAKANKYRIQSAVATTTSAVNTPIAGTTVDVQYSLDNGTTWYNLQSGTVSPATGTGELDISVTGELNTLVTGDWVDINDSAKGDVQLRFVAYGGNGTNDIRFANLGIEIETQLQAEVTSGGGSNDWSFDTNFNQPVLTTSSSLPVWFQDSIYASSTLTVQGDNFATTTIGSLTSYFTLGGYDLAGDKYPILSGIQNGTRLGLLDSQWYVIENASANSDPVFGLISADATTQASLTLATSTGELTITSNGTTTINNAVGVNIPAGACYMVDGECITGGSGTNYWDNTDDFLVPNVDKPILSSHIFYSLKDELPGLFVGSGNGSISYFITQASSTDAAVFSGATGGYNFDTFIDLATAIIKKAGNIIFNYDSSDNLMIGSGANATGSSGVAIGKNTSSGGGGIAIGSGASTANFNGAAFGIGSTASSDAFAGGINSIASPYGVSLGGYSVVNGSYSGQINVSGATSTVSGTDMFSIVGRTDLKVGISTTTPGAKLTIAEGDVYIASSTRGVIQKSPDGACWRQTVSNLGVGSFTSISCP